MTAYYNEIDPYAAEWLENLIDGGHIAPGTVDRRSIVDVEPDDLAGFDQCHFFAGIGVWSHALRLAGWPDDRPVWTGSCPCQPFSAAGKRGGTDDARHLWPDFFRLIAERRPPVVFGEQVASKDGLGWLGIVQADLEGADYASAAFDICAAGVGAPHIRQRLWIVAEGMADTDDTRPQGRVERGDGADQLPVGAHSLDSGLANAKGERQREAGHSLAGSEARQSGDSATGGLGDTTGAGCETRDSQPIGTEARPEQFAGESSHDGLANTDSGQRNRLADGEGRQRDGQETGRVESHDGSICGDEAGDGSPRPGPVNGLWRDADWLFCRDGKWRPVMSIHVQISDGLAPGMGCLCADEEAEREKVDAVLRGLREISDAEAVQQRGSGMPLDAGETEILRQDVHGGGSTERPLSEPQPQPFEGGEDGEGVLRDMRGGGEASRSSQGRRPAEQQALELDDVVRLLPPSRSLAELHGDRETSGALRALSETIRAEGPVFHTPDETQAIWASLGEEAKDRLRMGFDASRWRLVVPFPLTRGAVSRVGRLRAYGNAIVAPVAKEIIGAYLDTKV